MPVSSAKGNIARHAASASRLGQLGFELRHPLQLLLRVKLLNLHVAELFSAVAGQLFCLKVGLENLSCGGVYGEDGIVGQIEELAVAQLGFQQCLCPELHALFQLQSMLAQHFLCFLQAPVLFFQFPLVLEILELQLPALDGPAHRVAQLLEVKRLGEVIRRALAQALNGNVVRVGRRHDDDRRGQRAGSQLLDKLNPVHFRHADVRQDDVRVEGFLNLQCFAGRRGNLDGVTSGFQSLADGVAGRLLVVHYEYPMLRHGVVSATVANRLKRPTSCLNRPLTMST